MPRLSRRGTSWKKGMGAGGAQGKATISSPHAPPTPQNNGVGALLLGVWIFPARNLPESPWMVYGPRVDQMRMFSALSRQCRGKNRVLNHNREQLPPFFPHLPTLHQAQLSFPWFLGENCWLRLICKRSEQVASATNARAWGLLTGLKAAFQPTLALSLASESSWTTSR